MYDLVVVVINYRTPKMTIDCIASLLNEMTSVNGCIVLVDNYSNDDSNSILEKWISDNNEDLKIRFIRSNVNLGFSGGNNLGISEVDSKNYLLLNSDTLVKPRAIKRLLETAMTYGDAGIISPQLEDMEGNPQNSCFQYIHPISEFISSAQTGFFTRLLQRYNVPLPVESEINSPEWTSFACVLIKREVFDDVGLLDSEFFMYFEDTEFCFRARQHGWGIINDPYSHVVHMQGVSSGIEEKHRLKKSLPIYFYESRARYFYLLYGMTGLTIANLLWWSGRLISKTRQVLGRRDKNTCKNQWLGIWTNWLAPLDTYTHPDNDN